MPLRRSALASDVRAWGGHRAGLYHQPASAVDTPPLPDHAVAIHLAGSAVVERRADGRWSRARLRPGAVTLLPAQQPTAWRLEGAMSFFHIYLPPRLLVQTGIEEDGLSDGSAPELIGAFDARDALVEQIGGALLRELQEPGLLSRLYIDTLYRLLAVHLWRNHAVGRRAAPERSPTLAAPRLQRAVDLIEANLDEELTLAALAGAAGMSAFAFCRAFKAAMGLPPHRYLVKRRVERAMVLLRTTELPIIAVALACGFPSPQHFATVFRKLTGAAPRDFRAGSR